MAKLFGRIPAAKNKAEADALNRGFRSSDQDRWQGMDFVVGQEIKRSNSPDCDCELCKVGTGRYPKDFKWSGWHDRCKCHIVSILKTPEEMDRDDELIMAGKNPSPKSKNTVTQIPRAMVAYVKSHPELQASDWYTDNERMFN